jgi:anti-sigma factor RsiW
MEDDMTGDPIDRLLGPSGPEVSCETCFEELDRYVDLEVTGADAEAAVPGMAAHLEGCPACREEHDTLLALVRDERDRSPEP